MKHFITILLLIIGLTNTKAQNCEVYLAGFTEDGKYTISNPSGICGIVQSAAINQFPGKSVSINYMSFQLQGDSSWAKFHGTIENSNITVYTKVEITPFGIKLPDVGETISLYGLYYCVSTLCCEQSCQITGYQDPMCLCWKVKLTEECRGGPFCNSGWFGMSYTQFHYEVGVVTGQCQQ